MCLSNRLRECDISFPVFLIRFIHPVIALQWFSYHVSIKHSVLQGAVYSSKELDLTRSTVVLLVHVYVYNLSPYIL
jgi:hypothetical protein